MNIDEITSTYLSSHGLKKLQGNSAEAVLPFFIMDVAYYIYTKDIAPIPCRFEMKKVKKEWGTTYTKFNKEFFSNYTSDGVDSICDIMDSLTNSINNDVVITKTSIINFLPESIPFDKRYIIASISICNILVQISDIIWRKVYGNPEFQMSDNRLQRLDALSARFATLFTDGNSCKQIVNLNASQDIANAVQQLCNKIVKWVKNYKEN